ncbi:DUF4240 domain-containing protein [Panacibacter ginsenosidivorans]|uniref:DUF4240 domain-containing protein n=1 Tax=Panacibacter ginsenosidivorans TaxID=1813871 RepID=A0A5B8V6C9_9BACT|nr:DUF4240 domain-containing protein [Panacibacter ginsenosidivorans]QEC67010.1 DUF4240 domain-containing protein [Panacibacter ginsenosidivorans]
MSTLTIIILSFIAILFLRLLFRKVVDLPAFKGPVFSDLYQVDNIMLEENFWNIIHSAGREAKGNYQLQCNLLTEKLELLSTEEIIKFNRLFSLLMAKSFSYKIWEAAYALNGGCSDDAFEYFRSWLIAQGRNKFYWTLRYPRLLFLFGVKEMIVNYEGIDYCSRDAFENKTGNDIPDTFDIDYADGGELFKENAAFFKYPELALLTW